MLFGNLPVMADIQKRFPADAHTQILFTELAKEHGFPGLYYLDLYPFAYPLLCITDASVAAQTDCFPRHHFATNMIGGLLGPKSIFSREGAEWRAQYSWFAPAFSLQNLLTLVPGIVEETLVFREKISKLALTGERFSMNEVAMSLSIDVIARSGLDLRLKSQTKDSALLAAFVGATNWCTAVTDSIPRKIVAPFIMNWHTRTLDRLLGRFIKERYAASSMDNKSTKTITDIARHGYLKSSENIGACNPANLEHEFMKIAVDK